MSQPKYFSPQQVGGRFVVAARRKLPSADACEEFCIEFDAFLNEKRTRGNIVCFKDFDISQNSFTTDLLNRVFCMLNSPDVYVEKFRIFGTQCLRDESCQYLAKWLGNVSSRTIPLELHISDCCITQIGFQLIIDAIAQNTNYPRVNSPMFIRLENNYIEENEIKRRIDGVVAMGFHKTSPEGPRGTAKCAILVSDSKKAYKQKPGRPPDLASALAVAPLGPPLPTMPVLRKCSRSPRRTSRSRGAPPAPWRRSRSRRRQSRSRGGPPTQRKWSRSPRRTSRSRGGPRTQRKRSRSPRRTSRSRSSSSRRQRRQPTNALALVPVGPPTQRNGFRSPRRTSRSRSPRRRRGSPPRRPRSASRRPRARISRSRSSRRRPNKRTSPRRNRSRSQRSSSRLQSRGSPSRRQVRIRSRSKSQPRRAARKPSRSHSRQLGQVQNRRQCARSRSVSQGGNRLLAALKDEGPHMSSMPMVNDPSCRSPRRNPDAARSKAKTQPSIGLFFKDATRGSDADRNVPEVPDLLDDLKACLRDNPASPCLSIRDTPSDIAHSTQMARLNRLMSGSQNVDVPRTDRDPPQNAVPHASTLVEPCAPKPSTAVVPAKNNFPDSADRIAAMHEWLERLDNGKGSMIGYLGAIKSEFDCDFTQLRAVKLETPCGPGLLGTVDPELWDTLGIKSTGHRLLFAKGLTQLDALE